MSRPPLWLEPWQPFRSVSFLQRLDRARSSSNRPDPLLRSQNVETADLSDCIAGRLEATALEVRMQHTPNLSRQPPDRVGGRHRLFRRCAQVSKGRLSVPWTSPITPSGRRVSEPAFRYLHRPSPSDTSPSTTTGSRPSARTSSLIFSSPTVHRALLLSITPPT